MGLRFLEAWESTPQSQTKVQIIRHSGIYGIGQCPKMLSLLLTSKEVRDNKIWCLNIDSLIDSKKQPAIEAQFKPPGIASVRFATAVCQKAKQ